MSFAKILFHVTRPHTALLGNIPGTNVYRNTHQYPDANLDPGVLVVRVDSAIYFANANYVRERSANFPCKFYGKPLLSLVNMLSKYACG